MYLHLYLNLNLNLNPNLKRNPNPNLKVHGRCCRFHEASTSFYTPIEGTYIQRAAIATNALSKAADGGAKDGAKGVGEVAIQSASSNPNWTYDDELSHESDDNSNGPDGEHDETRSQVPLGLPHPSSQGTATSATSSTSTPANSTSATSTPPDATIPDRLAPSRDGAPPFARTPSTTGQTSVPPGVRALSDGGLIGVAIALVLGGAAIGAAVVHGAHCYYLKKGAPRTKVVVVEQGRLPPKVVVAAAPAAKASITTAPDSMTVTSTATSLAEGTLPETHKA